MLLTRIYGAASLSPLSPSRGESEKKEISWLMDLAFASTFINAGTVSYTHLTLPTTPYV